jgi:hypothetical protein
MRVELLYHLITQIWLTYFWVQGEFCKEKAEADGVEGNGQQNDNKNVVFLITFEVQRETDYQNTFDGQEKDKEWRNGQIVIGIQRKNPEE